MKQKSIILLSTKEEPLTITVEDKRGEDTEELEEELEEESPPVVISETLKEYAAFINEK